jgi:small subunit ribosomal protein S21
MRFFITSLFPSNSLSAVSGRVSWPLSASVEAGVLFSGDQSHKTEGRVIHRPLSEVIVGDGESFEAALRRFNKKIQQAGILAEARRREFYERPAARRKRKEAKRRKR